MPIPTPTDITETVGKTVTGVAFDEEDLIIRWTDGFSLISIGWDQGVDDPELIQPSLALEKHGPKAVAAGALSQAALDGLREEFRNQRAVQVEARERDLLAKLKAKYEPTI